MAAGMACTAIVKQVIQLLKFVGLNSQSKNENEINSGADETDENDEIMNMKLQFD